MTRQEQYEARKAERAKIKNPEDLSPIVLVDLADRLVTALERIADTYGSK